MSRKGPAVFAFGAVLTSAALLAQDRGLTLNFKDRTISFRVLVEDLEDAFTVLPSGDIRLLPTGPGAVAADDPIRVGITKAPGGLGKLTIQRRGNSYQTLVRPDNGFGDDNHLTGLPFGYQVLPAQGRASAGESWTQEFPAPQGPDKLRVAASYRFTYRGRKAAGGCPECVEIEIVGFRKFLPGPALVTELQKVLKTQPDSFYTEDRPFAAGSALFDLKEGFLHRFELNANPSQFMVLPVPGLMRRVTLERTRER